MLRALNEPVVLHKDHGLMRLLETICIYTTLNNIALTVNDILLFKELGSQATLHKKLHMLLEAGLVQMEVQSDARIKLVKPSDRALKLFSKIDKLFMDAART